MWTSGSQRNRLFGGGLDLLQEGAISAGQLPNNRTAYF